MQRQSPAARRFYAAFYRWAISTSKVSESGLHHPASCAKGLHTTIPLHDRAPAPLRITRHKSGPRDGVSAAKYPLQGPESEGRGKSEASLGTEPKEFVTVEVQSAKAKPFSTFKSKEFVVRYRSDASLMVEVAVPQRTVEDFEHKYAQGLKRAPGARIEIQKDVVIHLENRKLVSVLLSGTHEEVSKVWDNLWEYKPRLPVPDDVHEFASRPSVTLLPLETVLRRRRTNGTGTVELRVLEQQWMRFIAAHDLQGIAKETGTTINVEEPSVRPVDAASGHTEQARSFFISGRTANMFRARDAIYFAIKPEMSATRSKDKSQEQSRQDKKTETSKTEDEEAENRKAFPVDESLIVRRWFDIVGPSQIKIDRALMAGNGGGLLRTMSKAGCKTFKRGLKKGTFMAEGTPAELARLHKILERRVLRVCKDRGLAVHEVKMASKRPSEGHDGPTNGDKNDEQLRSDVRTALRALTHPVVVVTSREPGKQWKLSDKVRGARGVTVSSFSTVTLQPKPIISFNLKMPSRSWDAMCASNRLRVHLLAGTPRSAAIASVFTQPYEQPYDGTRQLFKMKVAANLPPGFMPPRLSSYGDVLSTISAVLLLERCVQVGDHMIVVAEVESCLNELKIDGTAFVDDTAGLSYLNRSYRSGGAPIEPLKLPELLPEEDLEEELRAAIAARRAASSRVSLDPLALGEEPAPRPHDIYRPLQNETGTDDRSHHGDGLDAEPNDDPIYNALKAAGDAEKSEQQIEQRSSMYDGGGAMSREVQEEEDDYDLGFQQTGQATSTQPSAVSQGTSGPLWGPEDVTREESERLAENAAPRVSNVSVSNTSSSRRPYSTSIRPAMADQLDPRRTFSSTVAFRSVSRAPSPQVDPSARNMTVADFFGIPDEGRAHARRVDSLVRAKMNASRAERRLARNPDLPDEEKRQLEHQILMAERKVSKKLAWNAAIDLRVMLDKGKVDFRRAQFMESAIEKGQAVLLDEARHVKELLNSGKIDVEKFEAIKKKLQETSEVLTTEAMRLRQVADEEGDYFESAAGEEGEEEGSSFDGFRGNR
ncbi:hypothetical protein DOTSEDRAFT_28179 [Dothistroma septosporum NZE10]|uniref:Flavin reductase like domain-containing protein n=1 Tax=Dothistroma septosporum (strain NZE10 / CBS 128990) TaxID=675120 RepID=N1PD66_DOTSN|nr:hypothetical protein DOTSEDRAFT_28179 [Dothistroma septosporum NZE10]